MHQRQFDLWALLLRRALLPIYYGRHGDKRFDRLRSIEANQWLSPLDIETLQLERMNRLLKHAHTTTPFYRRRLDEAGIGPGPINDLAHLQMLRPTTKEDLQTSADQMISTEYTKKSLLRDASGGSTGTPTVFYKDTERHNLRRADQIRHDRWTGWNVGERWALIWGAKVDLHDKPSFRQRLVDRYLHRNLTLDAFELSEGKMQRFAIQLSKFQPRMILGYANALDVFSRFLLDTDLAGCIRPSGIVSSAERLTEEARRRIMDAFGCPVLNRYGSREVGLVASECGAHRGLHINADNVYVEIIEDGLPVKPGASGDVLVTDFWNFGMPLIRFAMGDRAVASDERCPCGRGLPMIASIDGRSSDFLRAADGTRIHGEFFTHLFYDDESVMQFQVIQTSMAEVKLRIVPKAKSDVKSYDDVMDRIVEILGGSTKVQLELCDEIPPSASGKHRFTISHVDS